MRLEELGTIVRERNGSISVSPAHGDDPTNDPADGSGAPSDDGRGTSERGGVGAVDGKQA